MSDAETQSFRSNPRLAWQVVGLTLVLLVLLLFALSQAADPGPVQAALAVSFLVGLVAIFGYIAVRPPVQLRIGPDGIDLPIAWRAPLAWNEIRKIERQQASRSPGGRRDWLVIWPKQGVIPDYRLRSPMRLEQWYVRKFGIRVPLHGLAEHGDDIVAAIRAHFPDIDVNVG